MTLPLGYRYAAAWAGIRKVEKDDLALIVSDTPAAAAAVFTQNRVQAAPVRLSRQHLRESGGRARALLVNAGNANCATRTGDRVALQCCRAAARQLNAPVSQILPASTGVIGVEMDAGKIVAALPHLVAALSDSAFDQVARAIMTTDTVSKTVHAAIRTRQGLVRLAGMAKGAGMIHPLMATTLAFVVTDALVSPAALRPLLKRAAENTFNRLSVDGDTSTNDTLVLLANGASGVHVAAADLEKTLEAALGDLARQIARDGEGASKLITIDVAGASSDRAAARLARAIANSPLVKTAIAGADPNWGRLICAAGNAGVAFDPANVDIEMQGVRVCRGGLAADFSEEELTGKLRQPECSIRFTIRGKDRGKARFWTCDLTEGYIRINASYRT